MKEKESREAFRLKFPCLEVEPQQWIHCWVRTAANRPQLYSSVQYPGLHWSFVENFARWCISNDDDWGQQPLNLFELYPWNPLNFIHKLGYGDGLVEVTWRVEKAHIQYLLVRIIITGCKFINRHYHLCYFGLTFGHRDWVLMMQLDESRRSKALNITWDGKLRTKRH